MRYATITKLVQENHYYLYGALMGESTDILAANGAGSSDTNPYKFGGKELLAAQNANLGVYPARVLDFSSNTWAQSDPCCEDYAPTSPYVNCLGNPISLVDPDGKKVAVLLADDGSTISMKFLSFGHMAILIQNEEEKWLYYSINGVESSSGELERNDVAIEGNWNGPEEFLTMTNRIPTDNDKTSYMNLNHYNYIEAYIIDTTKEQDEIISQKFADYAKTVYNFKTNNCATTVQQCLIAGGLDKVGFTEALTLSPQFGGYGMGHNLVCVQPYSAFKIIMKVYEGIHLIK